MSDLVVGKITLPDMNVSNKKFEAAMRKLEEDQDRQRKREKDQPRKDFLKSASEAGFTTAQSEFMWKYLALAGHQHWNGMIG